MRTKPYARIKRVVEVQRYRRAKLVHRFTLQTDEERGQIAVLLDPDALCHYFSQRSSKSKLLVRHERIDFRSLRQVDHAGTVLSNYSFFRVVLKTVANHEHCLAVAIAAWIWECRVGCERHVAGHSAP